MSEEEKKEMPFVTKALIIAIVAVLVVVAAAGIAYFVATKAISKLPTAAEPKTEEDKKHEEASKHAEENKMGEMIEFGEYTTNLNEPEGRYIVCKITFEMEPKKEVVDPKGKKKEEKAEGGGAHGASAEGEAATGPSGEVGHLLTVLQDKVLSIFRSKTIADLSLDVGQVKLKEEIKESVNSVLHEEKVKNVYFGKWIIQ